MKRNFRLYVEWIDFTAINRFSCLRGNDLLCVSRGDVCRNEHKSCGC